MAAVNKLDSSTHVGSIPVVPPKKKVHYPFWFGGSASCCAAAVTHPLDLGKAPVGVLPYHLFLLSKPMLTFWDLQSRYNPNLVLPRYLLPEKSSWC